MNIYQLQYFLAAVECGSFSSASIKLCLSSQAISKAVKELEAEIGIKLLSKSNHGVELTTIGEIFFIEAQEAVSVFNGLSTWPRRENDKSDSTLNPIIALPDLRSLGLKCQPNDFNYTIDNSEAGSVRVILDASGACLAALESNVVHAAVIIGSTSNPNINCKLVGVFEPAVMVSLANKLCKEKTHISFQELKNREIIRPLDIRYTFPLITAIMKSRGVKPRCFINASNKDDVLSCLSRGGVMFVLPNLRIYELYEDIAILPLAGTDAFQLPFYLANKTECTDSWLTPLELCIQRMVRSTRSMPWPPATG